MCYVVWYCNGNKVFVNSICLGFNSLRFCVPVNGKIGSFCLFCLGDFGMQENKKHRATYQALGDSEKKLQFFSARQIACRLLGSRGYLCQKCWLPLEEDCMCSKVKPSSLWHGIRFWLYMHPKVSMSCISSCPECCNILRWPSNVQSTFCRIFYDKTTLESCLWQVLGVESATLCLYGIAEDEEIMWNACKIAGKDKVWCLYPNKNVATKSVQDAVCQEISADPEMQHNHVQLRGDTYIASLSQTNEYKPLNFILIDGTWSNSAAMFNRLKEKTKSVWGVEDLPCISLSAGVSTMHKLRPQPSWDRTCTAAAAIGLLSELQVLPQFSSYGLDKQNEALENAVDVLLEALTARRLRMGRSITRRLRHSSNISKWSCLEIGTGLHSLLPTDTEISSADLACVANRQFQVCYWAAGAIGPCL
ncbi:hypothetical protein NC653_031608 [Populus alba x Populus x berolinensis]|uniref:tRNA-uridine aminocarboxypropyltransferase n=1 Tax=Populus alba x Populus x berolinensis TaxID=444605 RepID=A0AAD6LYU2_9ROSI|nr:hypothetical protein NC653_031608 [Populus alba x Populus x berolinensis]